MRLCVTLTLFSSEEQCRIAFACLLRVLLPPSGLQFRVTRGYLFEAEKEIRACNLTRLWSVPYPITPLLKCNGVPWRCYCGPALVGLKGVCLLSFALQPRPSESTRMSLGASK